MFRVKLHLIKLSCTHYCTHRNKKTSENKKTPVKTEV